MVRSAYKGLLMAKNRILNLIDHPVVVLIYHRVTSLSSDPQLLAVSPDNFLNQMLYLKDNFPVLRFEDDWSKLSGPSVVVTFDDGYADNVREALPVLEKVGVPATFFISTGSLESMCEFWWDELERIILAGRECRSSFELRDQNLGKTWPTGNCAERNAMYQEMHSLIKTLDVARRDDWLRQLRAWGGLAEEGRSTHRTMTINELQKLSASGAATIGAHTVSHTPLAMLSSEEQQQEIVESRRQLEELTGRKVTVFSYPFGGKDDYTSDTVRLCRKAGYARAASNFPGQVHRWTDLHQIPRQLVRDWPLDIFRRKIKEFWYR